MYKEGRIVVIETLGKDDFNYQMELDGQISTFQPSNLRNLQFPLIIVGKRYPKSDDETEFNRIASSMVGGKLFGDVILAKNMNGNLVGLTDKDINHVLNLI